MKFDLKWNDTRLAALVLEKKLKINTCSINNEGEKTIKNNVFFYNCMVFSAPCLVLF